MLRSLAVLKDQSSNKNLKHILEEVYRRVEDGSTLGDAMARFPRAFNEMAINMVRAGGEGGFLEDALEALVADKDGVMAFGAQTLGDTDAIQRRAEGRSAPAPLNT